MLMERKPSRGRLREALEAEHTGGTLETQTPSSLVFTGLEAFR